MVAGQPKRESAAMSLPPNTSQRDLVRLALLDGDPTPQLDPGPRLLHLLAHLRPRCGAVDGHDVWAAVAGLVDLEVLFAVTLGHQPLAMHFPAVLLDTLLYLLLLCVGWASPFLCWRPPVHVSPMVLHHTFAAEYLAAMVRVNLAH